MIEASNYLYEIKMQVVQGESGLTMENEKTVRRAFGQIVLQTIEFGCETFILCDNEPMVINSLDALKKAVKRHLKKSLKKEVVSILTA